MGYLTTVGRRSVSRLLRCLSENQWDSLFIKGKSLIPSNFTFKDPGVKVHRLAHVMSARNSQEFYHRLVSYWDEPVVCDFDSTTHRFTTLPEQSNLSTFLEEMMLTDMLHYLPDDILVKVDRATMAVSLEARAPLLDPNVISFAWTLPERMKLRDGEAKWLLKKVLYRYVPKTLVDRPKMGFGVPIASWLRGPLKAWASELLSEQALSQGGYLDPAPIRLRWREHLEGKRNWQYHLWTVLMWQSWRGNYSE